MNYPPGTEYSGDGVLYDSFGETSSEFGGNLESPNEVAVSSLPGDLDRQKRRERNRRQNRNRNRERFDRDRVDRPLICNESAVQGFLEGNYRDEEYGDYSCEIEQGYPDRRDSSYNNFGDRGNCDDRRGRNRGRRDRERNRDRDRNRGRDRDRERDRDRSRDRERDRDWREEIPNNTIMVRGLAPHISEADLRNEVTRYGLEPKDIRLMRKKYKDTGASRGFAFVEFLLLSEAVRWKELTQGVLIFGGDYRATLHYSIPKDGSGMKRNDASRADWSCSKCGLNNFRRRDVCFKCNTPREEAEEIRRQSGDGFEQISSTPSNALLLRNLDTLTTEERVLSVLGQLTSLPIKSIGIANDPLTNTSRGFCFVELHSISEASQLHDLLLSLDGQFYIDGRPVTITYARKSVNVIHSAASANAASVALAAAQWTNQVEPGSLPVNKNEQYQQGYDQYQADYNSSYQYNYGDLGGDNVGVARAEGDAHKSDGVKLKKGIQSSATISAGPRGVTASNVQANLGSVVVDGVSYAKYLPPDTSTYQYDDTSGYYYDPSTGLYYDANSQYYYNAEAQQFLYWDGEKQTYLPAPTQTSVAGGTDTESTKDEKSKNRDKQDKVKIAKKIAKDMERWAKTLNQKKENAKLGLSGIPTKSMLEQARQSAAADAGFAVLEKRNTIGERQALVSETLKKELEETKKFQMPLTGISKPTLKPNLVAAYGDGSDSDTEPEPLDVLQPVQNPLKAWEMKLTDLKKMACLLCKRQFPNKDALTRHQKLSDLHKQNMEALRRTIDTQEEVEVVKKDERKPF